MLLDQTIKAELILHAEMLKWLPASREHYTWNDLHVTNRPSCKPMYFQNPDYKIKGYIVRIIARVQF